MAILYPITFHVPQGSVFKRQITPNFNYCNLHDKLYCIVPTNLCATCMVPETTSRFLLYCTRFTAIRKDFVNELPIECVNVRNFEGFNPRYDHELDPEMPSDICSSIRSLFLTEPTTVI